MEDLGNEVVGPSRADDPSEWVGSVFQNGAVSMQTRTIQLHWGEIFLAHCAALPLVLRPCTVWQAGSWCFQFICLCLCSFTSLFILTFLSQFLM